MKSLFTSCHLGHSLEGILTICLNGVAPLNKMTAMLLCVKTLKFFFYRTTTALRLILGILHQGLKIYPVCSHDYPKMIFDIFYEKVKFVSVAVLEECCMASADTQWLFYPSERIVTHEGLALFHILVRRCDINFNEVHF